MGEGFGSMRWRVEIILQKSELGGRGWKGRIYGVVAKWNSLDGSVPRITRARSPSLFRRRPTRVHRRLLRFVLFKTVATAADEHATRCLILRKGFIPQPLSLPLPPFLFIFFLSLVFSLFIFAVCFAVSPLQPVPENSQDFISRLPGVPQFPLEIAAISRANEPLCRRSPRVSTLYFKLGLLSPFETPESDRSFWSSRVRRLLRSIKFEIIRAPAQILAADFLERFCGNALWRRQV